MDQSITLDCLGTMGFKPCAPKEHLNPMGLCFEPDPSMGEGYYWFYEQPGMFSVAQMELIAKDDYIMEYQQPDFVSINYYDTIAAEELNPYRKVSAHCIRGHVASGELFRIHYHKNIPIKGFELMIMPGYYHDFLQQQYPGQFVNSTEAFRSIDGCTNFPELILVLQQIANFKGSGASAELYYGSKVAEALSLVIEHSKNATPKADQEQPYRIDYSNLDSVKSYLDDNFAYDVKTEQLARIACMGQSKLRASFKQQYGSTITDYIQSRRIALAESLLINTDFSIKQIAETVGYQHAGRFSILFKKETGLSPHEYRNAMQ